MLQLGERAPRLAVGQRRVTGRASAAATTVSVTTTAVPPSADATAAITSSAARCHGWTGSGPRDPGADRSAGAPAPETGRGRRRAPPDRRPALQVPGVGTRVSG